MKQSNVRYNKTIGKAERRVTIIEQYYNKVKPDIPYEEFQKICETPFKHVRTGMMSGDVYEYRYNFFGNIVPRPSSIVWLLGNLRDNYIKEKIQQSKYNKYVGGITRYISRNPKRFKRYADKLLPWIDIRTSSNNGN